MRPAPHLRILVIDDNRAIHEDFRKILGPATSAGIDEAEADFFGETSEKPGLRRRWR